MARSNLFFLAIFVIFAAIALSLPTNLKRDDLTPGEKLSLEGAVDDLKSATKMMNGFDNQDSNNQKNEVEHAPSSTWDSNQDGGATGNVDGEEDKKVQDNQPTRTQKKPTSGNFVTPTATHTHKPTSEPNALGKLPIVGGLLGGTGSGL
ncbi:uncharacterized protein N7483_012144 [Penicillium malachiteum]|uniref:uncharacterized protein n=1 Tax=Penicillium malachiteum TaxID=1324776 RepID=UPI002548A80B|nr:uncharacterized protein N7483_012144 [Penicillium malachiteum]KAJ5714963.1 hypothetical protein N7483_012144 [Penicillium malachiteum]